MAPKHSLTLRLNARLYRWLELLSDKTELGKSDVLRQALREKAEKELSEEQRASLRAPRRPRSESSVKTFKS